MSNKLSVFGNTGFIGGRFCEMYSNRVIKIDRESRSPQSSELVYFISTIDNYNIHKDLHVDVNTNLSILMSVLENINKNDPNVIINFVSSWFVYGKNPNSPFNEETTHCNPTGFYSITKRCAEQMLISFCETFNIKYRIFRLANVIGEGDNKISRKKNAMQFLLKQAVDGEELLLYNGGTAKRDYIYVDDVCDAIIHCVDNAPVNEIINIGTGIPTTLIDAMEIAVKESKSTSIITKMDPPHFHQVVQVEHAWLDVSKLKSYGFETKYSVEDTIKKLVKYYKDNKIK
jgi:nucleoside-diphosphate-sugar epimerase